MISVSCGPNRYPLLPVSLLFPSFPHPYVVTFGVVYVYNT